MLMARRYRMLPVPSFSHYFWVECDIDKGWLTATKNALECANLLFEGYFRALYVPYGGSETQIEFYTSMFSDKSPFMPLCFGIVERRCNHIVRGFFDYSLCLTHMI